MDTDRLNLKESDTNMDLIMYKCNNGQFIPKKQIIQRRIDPKLMSGKYYAQVKRSIKKRIKDDTELLIIQIIPKNEISEKCIVHCIMCLQREFTSIITIPMNTVDMKKEEFDEFEIVFDCNILRD